MTGVTGTGAISIINRHNRNRKTFFLVCFDSGEKASWNGRGFTYKFPIKFQNHIGLIKTTYIPIKQPGEIGPKPIIAKTEKTEINLSCAKFIF